ncbi:MAG TPA: hypothetical protein VGZ24_04840 [Chthoniobacterales bacterium]|jgi:uncharacterized protein (UPF0332 family)|nr:hypothetical protein [Chthoniobacterales bacterium]
MNMSLEQWAKNGWLRPHKSSKQEIADLLRIVDRDLKDAESDISSDWKFGIAYNAALKLCTILLHASGYRPEQKLGHYRTITSLPLVLGNEQKDNADYLDTCRGKRNTAEYDSAGAVSDHDVKELVGFVREMRRGVMEWLQKNHPELLR